MKHVIHYHIARICPFIFMTFNAVPFWGHKTMASHLTPIDLLLTTGKLQAKRGKSHSQDTNCRSQILTKNDKGPGVRSALVSPAEPPSDTTYSPHLRQPEERSQDPAMPTGPWKKLALCVSYKYQQSLLCEKVRRATHNCCTAILLPRATRNMNLLPWRI